jgi:tetratricopeptide (TPR) repeat protein
MEITELLKKSEEAFHKMDWKEVSRVNKEIMGAGVDERNGKLAAGFYHYARAKLEKDPEKIIAELEAALESFESSDDILASMARTERLILLSGFDEDNRGRHLKALGEAAIKDFGTTCDPNHLKLAIKAFEDARPFHSGRDAMEISKNLTFCLANYAPYTEKPEELYERILALSDELGKACEEKQDLPDLARARMNSAIASQKLAFTRDKDLIKDAIDHAKEAIGLFEKEGLQLEMVRSKQALANIYKDAAHLHPEKMADFLEKALGLQKEVAFLYKEGKYELNRAYASMEVSATLLELAGLVPGKKEEYLVEASGLVEEAMEIFRGEKMGVEFGQAKMALGVIMKKQGDDGKGAELLKEAAEIFDREGMQDLKEKAEELAGK